MNDKIFQEIKNEVKIKFKKTLTYESSIDELGIDSIDLLDLIVELEDKLNIKFSDSEINGFKTIKDIVEVVEKKQK